MCTVLPQGAHADLFPYSVFTNDLCNVMNTVTLADDFIMFYYAKNWMGQCLGTKTKWIQMYLNWNLWAASVEIKHYFL